MVGLIALGAVVAMNYLGDAASGGISTSDSKMFIAP
jgi:hypothetical protein